jgi:mannosyltransferase
VTGLPTVEAAREAPDTTARSRQVGNRRFLWAVAACTVAAAGLALYRIGHDSFWLDEAASLRFARRTGWAEVLTESNGNMALYFGFLKLWVPFATGEAAVRLLSAFPFVLTVPAVALLGRRTSGARAGVLAAAIAATHPMLVRYGQEARGFSLVTLLVTAGALALVVGVQTGKRRAFLAGVVLLGIAPYAHPVAALTGIVLIAWLWWLPLDALPFPRRWALCVFAVMVTPMAFLIARAGSSSLSWTGRGSYGGVTSLLSVGWQNASSTPAGLAIGGAAVVGSVLTVGAIRRHGHTINGWMAGVPLVWVVGTGILVIVVSLRQSLLVPRYELLVVPGVALLAASLIRYVSWSRIAALLLVAAALFNAVVVVERGGEYRAEEWRQAQAFVASLAQSGDGILFAPTSKAVPYEYYQVQDDETLPDAVLPKGSWGNVDVDFGRLTRDRPTDIAASDSAISGHDRMWLVVGRGPGGGPSQSFLQSALDALTSTRRSTGSWEFGRVKVQLYEPR